MGWKDTIFNRLTESMTRDQATAKAGMARKLSRALPATPPQHQRVMKDRFGTKEHYRKRGDRLENLATAIGDKSPARRKLNREFRARMSKAQKTGVSPLSSLAPDLVQKNKDLDKEGK